MISGQCVAVVIGRNEGLRLGAALDSVTRAGLIAIYVDSGSTDLSLGIAGERATLAVELSPDRFFSAARARNAGLTTVCKEWPNVRFVMFLDGDCVLIPEFIPIALAKFDVDAQVAIVTGHVAERDRDASTYNLLCSLEWGSPAGEITNNGALGGIMMARISDLTAVQGFNEQVVAGEDSELGARLRLRGKKIIKVDAPMAVHDADMKSFRQWWRRSVRAGHAIGHRYVCNGQSEVRDCARELRSTLFWGLAVPLCILFLLPQTKGLSAVLLTGYLLLYWRIRNHFLRSGVPKKEARIAARFGIYSKFANAVGLLQFAARHIRGQHQLIEHKFRK